VIGPEGWLRSILHPKRGIGQLLVLSLLLAVAVPLVRRALHEPEGVDRLESGTELLFVFVGSSTCGATEAPGFTELVGVIRERLAAQARSEDYQFVTVGVALDWSIPAGLGFLEEFGPFDEIMTGRSWLNAGGVRYMWRDLPGEPACPSVLVTTRQVVVDRMSITVSEETLHLRKVGVTEIEAWADLGFPMFGKMKPPSGDGR
jgi:hypothetical protein